MIKYLVGSVVWLFIAVILLITLNTTIMGNFVPIMDDVANNSDFVDYSRYQDRAGPLTTVFYFVMVIMVFLPIIWLAFKLWFGREPDPYERGYY